MERKYLYIEGTSGISGDMFVGAMIDLGADLDVLGRAIESIDDDGFGVDVARIKKSGIDCVDFDVYLEEDLENFDDDMDYLYGTDEEAKAAVEAFHRACEEAVDFDEDDCECGCSCHHHEDHECHCHHHEEDHECHCGHHHGDEAEECHCGHHHDHDGACIFQEQGSEGHCHEDMEDLLRAHDENAGHHEEMGNHTHAGGHHCHRNLGDVSKIIEAADMTESAKKLAHAMFHIVAEAEARAHRLPINEVHFHEVGAIDSVVDIISAAVCFDNLGITDVFIPELWEGKGTVRCQHGILPIPVPATANIVSAYDLNLKIMDVKGEFVTPTGAAIAAAIRTSDTLPAHFKVLKVGIGAGKREYTERPGFLRAMLIEPEDESATETETDDVVLIETDIDDSTGEALGYVMERLMKAGAREAHYTPVFMKKGRPAWELSVLCDREKKEEIEDIIFHETTTIGIREVPIRRTVLPREEICVATPYGEAEVKVVSLGDALRFYPEYESVRKIAEDNGLSFQDVYDMVKRAAEE